MGDHLGVEFIYESTEDQPIPEVKLSLKPAVSNLPEALRTALYEAASSYSLSNVEKVVEQIKAVNSDLAEEILALAKQFDFNKILDTIRE
jgi:hypothetical protein